MATFNNNYSGLITKGLGLPANIGLLSMGFSLFHIQIFVQRPPSNIGGSGGGSYIVPENQYYTPISNTKVLKDYSIDISVKFAGTKTWRHSYLVNESQSKHVVKIIHIVNKLRNQLQFKVVNIKQHFNKRD